MKKIVTKKLVVASETLRHLTATDLHHIVGGGLVMGPVVTSTHSVIVSGCTGPTNVCIQSIPCDGGGSIGELPP
jgi:hypothetical protein